MSVWLKCIPFSIDRAVSAKQYDENKKQSILTPKRRFQRKTPIEVRVISTFPPAEFTIFDVVPQIRSIKQTFKSEKTRFFVSKFEISKIRRKFLLSAQHFGWCSSACVRAGIQIFANRQFTELFAVFVGLKNTMQARHFGFCCYSR